jgi:carboxyl-terminal processing protease
MARRSHRRSAVVAATVCGAALLAAVAGASARASDATASAPRADAYTRAFSSDEYRVEQTRLAGRATGLGLRLRIDHGALVVAEVDPGTPAATAGLSAGEQFVSIDDRPVDAHDFSRVVGQLRASRSMDAVVSGPEGPRRVRLTPGEVTRASVTHRASADQARVVDVNEIVRGSADGVVNALRDAKDSGVVLDLRGNGGGLITEAVALSGAFLGEGAGVTYVRFDGTTRTIALPDDGVHLRSPLVVLVDHRTASAAEVVAGVLQDHGRAVVVGSATFGKGSVQEPVQLPDGSILRRTVGTYALPSGRGIEATGLVPDVVVPAIDDDDVAERAALSVLQGLAPFSLEQD